MLMCGVWASQEKKSGLDGIVQVFFRARKRKGKGNLILVLRIRPDRGGIATAKSMSSASVLLLFGYFFASTKKKKKKKRRH
jgi:hypothetical protein